MEEMVFEPIIVDTREVAKELKAVATTHQISMKNVDFHLHDTATFFRTNDTEEWEELTDNKRDMFEADDFLSYEGLQLFQQYKIEIFNSKPKAQSPLPKITLGSNKILTSIIATIHKTNDVDTSSYLEQRLINEINKKKAKAGILVGIREKNMKKEIEAISSKMMVNGFLDSDMSFEVMEGVKPVPCINDDMIMHYQKKVNKEDEQGRINYARRGYILPVEKDEVIIEYIKAKEGKNGRNCRGQYIKVKEPVIKNNKEISVTEAISIKEDDDGIKYVANKQGYVKEEKGVYDIQDEMEIESVDFKNTGSIEAGVDSNVTINIRENDDFKDAIGEGMKVETSTLNVEGSVAKNAKIEAIEVTIGGQTHKTSTIKAKKAKIAVHRGTVSADEIEIDRLEGGTIIGDVVRVKNALGGEIIAREIYIDTLISNVSLITSELVDIKHSRGSNNKILVDPSQIKGLSEKINAISQKIEKAKKEYNQLPKQLEYKKDVIESSKSAVEAIKQRIIELKSQKVTPPKNLAYKLKEYQQLINEYNLLLKDLKDKKEEIRLLQEELDGYQSKVFNAKILNHSAWSEYNEIRFKLIYPPIEVIHNTRKNEMSREITLEKTTDDEYEIKRATEYKK